MYPLQLLTSKHKGSYDLSSTFREMATSTNLMGSEVHEVQEAWTGWKNLRAAYCVAKSSPKDICFFRVMLPTISPKIMGLRRIHSLEALHQWSGLSFCLWCGKEGQNEGTLVNHLHTSHYHLGLICSCCIEYFTTSTDTMCQHSQLCKLAPVNDDDNDWEEESNDDHLLCYYLCLYAC